MLKIEPSSPDERALVVAALEADPSRVVTIRCDRGCAIARVAATPVGLVFVGQAWEVRSHLGHELVIDGKRASRRETVREVMTDDVTGDQVDGVEKHATLAMLGRDSERVDLLTRCKHGDAILDRDAVMAWHAAGRSERVHPTMGATSYQRPEPWGTSSSTTTVTRRIGGPAVPIAELDAWLAGEFGSDD